MRSREFYLILNKNHLLLATSINEILTVISDDPRQSLS